MCASLQCKLGREREKNSTELELPEKETGERHTKRGKKADEKGEKKLNKGRQRDNQTSNFWPFLAVPNAKYHNHNKKKSFAQHNN